MRGTAARSAGFRPMPRAGDGHTVSFVLKSTNAKTGPMPVSMTDAASCPEACTFKNAGCYAERLPWLRHHWSRVPDRGLSWRQFCAHVIVLPHGQVWRYGEAGDLPGRGDALDVPALEMLVRANKGKRGHTFTHKPLRTLAERDAVHAANARGFTINLSADSLTSADELAELNVAPVAVVLPEDAPRGLTTPAGRKVVLCPYDTHLLPCSDCQLCTHPARKAIIGFRAHGQGKKVVSKLVQLRRRSEAA